MGLHVYAELSVSLRVDNAQSERAGHGGLHGDAIDALQLLQLPFGDFFPSVAQLFPNNTFREEERARESMAELFTGLFLLVGEFQQQVRQLVGYCESLANQITRAVYGNKGGRGGTGLINSLTQPVSLSPFSVEQLQIM